MYKPATPLPEEIMQHMKRLVTHELRNGVRCVVMTERTFATYNRAIDALRTLEAAARNVAGEKFLNWRALLQEHCDKARALLRELGEL